MDALWSKRLNMSWAVIAACLTIARYCIGLNKEAGSYQYLELEPTDLKQAIQHSLENPICVVFINKESISNYSTSVLNHLEFARKKISQQTDQAGLEGWTVGVFSFQKHVMFPQKKPKLYPTLRCFLQENHYHDFTFNESKAATSSWIKEMVTRHQKHFKDATVSSINSALFNKKTVVLLFPTKHNHLLLEEKLFHLCSSFENVVPMVVHDHAEDFQLLKQQYAVKSFPTVIIAYSNTENESDTEIEFFDQTSINSPAIQVSLFSRQISAKRLSYNVFHEEVINPDDYAPYVILIYNIWSTKTLDYLSTYKRSVEEFQELQINLRFGLLDVTHQENAKVLTKLIDPKIQVQLPMILIVFKGENGHLVQKKYKYGHLPTPSVLHQFITSCVGFVDKNNKVVSYKPFGEEVSSEHCEVFEGPHGNTCSLLYHNATNNEPTVHKPREITRTKSAVNVTGTPDWHRMFGSEEIERKLAHMENIPVLSLQYWAEVIERSHAPNHLLLGGNQFAGEITKVAMVVFIIGDCGSCRMNMPLFKDLQNAVRYTDGGSLYMVNCSVDHLLCKNLDVKGFPTIAAFRGIGWLTSGHCVSPSTQGQFSNYIRVDYHGVMRLSDIMEWFSKASEQSVSDLKSSWTGSFIQSKDKDVQLFAVLSPYKAYSDWTGIHKDYPYECFRLACERLFGSTRCFTVFDDNISEEKYHETTNMAVSKIFFLRRDGVKATAMEAGTNLASTMEDDSQENLHKFHRPHGYDLVSDQKCEDDHAVCTDLITAFTRDHGRMPVTHITSDTFHIRDSFGGQDGKLMIVLVHPDNITDDKPLLKTLESIAYKLYDQLAVVTLDVQQYPAWSGRFIPQGYSLARSQDTDSEDPLGMFMYPRMCFVHQDAHNKAAFYPPLGRTRNAPWFIEEKILHFAQRFLSNARGILTYTEHF